MTNKMWFSIIIEVIFLMKMFISAKNADNYCNDPGIPVNGMKNSSIYNEGEVIRFKCKKGYTLLGSKNRECLSNRTWSGIEVKCVVTHCPDPGIPENGIRLGNNFKVGGKIYFKCSTGYDIIGSFERYCMSNGQWSGELTSCDHENYFCIDPGIPVNGMKNSSSYNEGEVIQFKCKPGYILLGSKTRECLSNRTWSGMEVKCMGPNDFDNVMQISDILNADIDEKITQTKLSLGKRFIPYFKGKLYLYFAFDVSRRIGEENFRKTIAFAKAIVEKMSNFNIDVRVGVVKFRKGSSATEFAPSQYTETKHILNALDGMDFERYWAYGLGPRTLDRMRTEFGTPNGSTTEKYIIFILTDGDTHFEEASERAAEILKQEGVDIFCISVANPVRKSFTYRGIYGNYENMRREFEGISYDNFPQVMLNTLPKETEQLILYFTFDVSINIDNFQESIKFSKTLVRRMGIFNTGAVTFSSESSKIQFLPTQFTAVEDVLVALENIRFADVGNSSKSALELLRTSAIPLTEMALLNRTENRKQILIILTDGKTMRNKFGKNIFDEKSRVTFRKEERRLLRDIGVDIYDIGTSSIVLDSATKQLYKIASGNEAGSKDQHFFTPQNYDELTLLAQKITNGTIDYSQCGIELPKLSRGRGKVAGGRNAIKPWPWMANINYNTPDVREDVWCGGSIIHEKFILTAAHCLYLYTGAVIKENDISVKLGLTDRDDEAYMESFAVDKFFIHHKYVFSMIYDYDIALLKLTRSIYFNDFIRPICLPSIGLRRDSNLYKPDDFVVAIGWGHPSVLSSQQTASTSVVHLKEVLLPIQSSTKCTQSLRRWPMFRNIPSERMFTERMICAGDGRGNDTCPGDSGGPVMQSQLSPEGKIYWTQIAITSWGVGCGLPNTYGYYTHVQQLYSWVTNIIELK